VTSTEVVSHYPVQQRSLALGCQAHEPTQWHDQQRIMHRPNQRHADERKAHDGNSQHLLRDAF